MDSFEGGKEIRMVDHIDRTILNKMHMIDDYFDKLISEIPEVDMRESDTMLVQTGDEEYYVVQKHLITKSGKDNIFAPIVVISNNVTYFPYKVDFVAQCREHVENFLNEYKIPFTEVLVRTNKIS